MTPVEEQYNRHAKVKRKFKTLTVVLGTGTSSIVNEQSHEPIIRIMSLIVETAVKLKRDGHRVVLVSSGAIGVGLQRMSIDKKPKQLSKKQALAAIGQCRLMSIWDKFFTLLNQPVAQILLTRNDIADHSQYVNAQNTLNQVLAYGVIPIVNENDTVAVSEIKFGDNDTLSANTAAMLHADYLFLMTDVEALYDKNPRIHPDAAPIRTVEDIEALRADVSSSGSALGTGGMATKIIAAKIAISVGTTTIITKSSEPGRIEQIISYFHPSPTSTSDENLSQSAILDEPPLHTRFLPSQTPIRDRAFWILHCLVPQGTIYIDRGAAQALANKAGLLPVGIVDVAGNFAQQEAVRIVVVDRITIGSLSHFTDTSSTDRPETPGTLSRSHSSNVIPHAGEEIGRAVVNYNADQINRIKGHRSSDMAKILEYVDTEYVVHRSNISLRARSRPQTPRPLSFFHDRVGIGSVTPMGVDRSGGTPDSSISDLRAVSLETTA